MAPARRILPLLAAVVTLAAGACGGRAGGGRAVPSPAPTGPGSPPPAAAAPTAPITPGGPALPVRGSWRLLPPAPVPSQAQFLVGVWTGREMLIHAILPAAGASYRGVTYAYRPASRTWATLPPGPAPLMAEGNETAVWTGTEMIVFGLTSAAYNPATSTWRRLPRPLGGVANAAWVWTGRQAIFWGGGCCGGASDLGAAYTPATNSWERLPPAPLSARRGAAAAWTGREMVIVGGFQPPHLAGAGDRERILADAAAYNPVTRTWRRLPPMPGPRSSAMTVYDGSEVLVIGGTRAHASGPAADGVALRPAAGQWRRLPAMEFGRWDAAAVWTGRDVLIWGGMTGTFARPVIPPHGAAYRPTTGRWSALPMAPLRGRSRPVAVWTGSSMIVWGGFEYTGTQVIPHPDGAAYRPPAA